MNKIINSEIEGIRREIQQKRDAQNEILEYTKQCRFKTSCLYMAFNLNACDEEDVLFETFGEIKRGWEDFKSGRQELEELPDSKVKYKIYGFSYDDWKHDFKLRLKMIRYTQTENLLSLMQVKLDESESEESKVRKTISDIKQKLRDMRPIFDVANKFTNIKFT
ncbi:MAG: hypothetical protein ACRCWR_06995 [Saezia sp.]